MVLDDIEQTFFQKQETDHVAFVLWGVVVLNGGQDGVGGEYDCQQNEITNENTKNMTAIVMSL